MLSAIVKLLRLASFVICLIVIASFVVFAANQAKSASNEQQQSLQESSSSPTAANSNPPAKHKESSIHKGLDEASAELTSPFAGLFSGSHSQCTKRGGELILALLIYGFALGYVARVLRVRT